VNRLINLEVVVLRIEAVFAQALAGLRFELSSATLSTEDAPAEPAVVPTDKERKSRLALCTNDGGSIIHPVLAI
jgi:hypothetical protein